MAGIRLAAGVAGAMAAGSLLALPAQTRSLAPAAQAVTVRMSESACRLSRTRVTTGGVGFKATNVGRRARSFSIARRHTPFIRPRRSGALSVAFAKPGRYRYVCAARGQPTNVRTGFLRVVAPPPPPPPAPPPPSPPPPSPPPPPPPPPPVHPIGVRAGTDSGEFYDRRTNVAFGPRGNSYVQLGPVQTASGVVTDHNTLNVGAYDPARAETALERMHADGYNLVRIFLNPNCIDACLGDPTTHGLRAAYVANLADFLRRAKANGLAVMLEGHDAPPSTVYASLINSEPRTYIENINLSLLTSGGVQAHSRLWHDLIAALLAQGAPTDAIFAIDPYVETFFDTLHKPFTLGSGLVTTGNGNTYDIADPAQRNAMMDDNLVYFADQVRASILSVDPTALVTISFFAPQDPNPWRVGDFRLIRTKPVFDRSQLDFFTIHPYPGSGLTLPQFMENFGLAGTEQKPILFGEFGAYAVPFVYTSPADAAPALQKWVANSCAFGVDGWSLWTWDTGAQPDNVTLWNALDDGGVLEHALAPTDRPDPCAATAPFDLAFDRPATSSASLPGEVPALAFDLGHGSAWRSGGAAPQWIEVDLGSSSTIAKVRLTEQASPITFLGGRVLGGPAPNPSTQLFVFGDQFPVSGTVLEFTGSWPNVRYLRIETTDRLDVGWREIEAYAP